MKNPIQMRKSIPSIRNTYHESKNNNMKSMKNKLVCLNRIASVVIAVITILTLIPSLTATPTSTVGCGVTGVIEQYGIGHSPSGDTPLRWKAFIPRDGEMHPAIIVIHGGEFKYGDFTNTQTDQDLVCAGFCVFDIEYRLAPPGKLPGQGRDPGHYPEQTDDVATAIRAARNPAPTSVAFGRVNGKVGAVGGSAGASHAAYCAAAPTLGSRPATALPAWRVTSTSRRAATARAGSRPAHPTAARTRPTAGAIREPEDDHASSAPS